MTILSDLFRDPARAAKPRDTGITHVMDKGMSLAQVSSLIEVAEEHVAISGGRSERQLPVDREEVEAEQLRPPLARLAADQPQAEAMAADMATAVAAS